jgi:uncharacterized protein YjbJ (UPF0337 family)
MSAETMKKKGQANPVKGNVIAAAGRATGNDKMTASGRADVAEGKAQSAVGGAGQKVKRIVKDITGKR